MSAGFDTRITLTGSNDELSKMIDILLEYDNKGSVYFNLNSISRDNTRISLFMANRARIKDILALEGAVQVEAEGPYGYFALLSEIDVFKKMAVSAPGAEFHAEIDGFTSYNNQTLKASLKNGILHTETWCSGSNDDCADAYVDYFKDKLSYSEFCMILGIDMANFSVNSYDDFIMENTAVIELGYGGMDYEGFVDYMDAYSSSEITEDAFEEFCNVLEERDIACIDDFESEAADANGETIIETYDPVNQCVIEMKYER